MLIVGMSNPLIRDRHPDQRSILRALLFEISLTNSGQLVLFIVMTYFITMNKGLY